MNAQGIVHVIKGGEIQRNSVTLCGIALESLPRADCSLPYRLHDHATCAQCAAKVSRIETMRGVRP